MICPRLNCLSLRGQTGGQKRYLLVFTKLVRVKMSLIFETEPLAKFLHCGGKHSVAWFWEFLPKQFPDYWFVRPTEGFEYTGGSLHIICIAAVLSCILGTTLFAVSRSRPCWFCPRLPFMHLVPHQLRMFLSCFWCPSWHTQYLRFVLVRLSILPPQMEWKNSVTLSIGNVCPCGDKQSNKLAIWLFFLWFCGVCHHQYFWATWVTKEVSEEVPEEVHRFNKPTTIQAASLKSNIKRLVTV